MTMPDARDLDALSRGERPPVHAVPGLPLSGPRPFYSSFEASARAAVGMLRPKTVGGLPLPTKELASALATAVGEINADVPVNHVRHVWTSLRAQAHQALTEAVAVAMASLREGLAPWTALPAAEFDKAVGAADEADDAHEEDEKAI